LKILHQIQPTEGFPKLVAPTGVGYTVYRNNIGGSPDDVIMVSPTLVVDARIGLTYHPFGLICPEARSISPRSKSATAEGNFSRPDLTRLMVDASPETANDQDTNLTEVHDISSQVDTDGTVHWARPSGDQSWEILRIGYTSC
jgi:hypothetical protein